MTAYRVTYYNMSDGINSVIIAAKNPAEAEEIARQRDDLLVQIKQTEYIGDKPMTTPTNPAPTATEPDKITAAELRARIDGIDKRLIALRERVDQIADALDALIEGLKHAATAGTQDFSTMIITTIIKAIDDNGKDTFKAQGEPFTKHGVRIWDEVLPSLGIIDPAALKYGRNPVEGIPARVLMGETKNRETGVVGIGPRKVTGKA